MLVESQREWVKRARAAHENNIVNQRNEALFGISLQRTNIHILGSTQLLFMLPTVRGSALLSVKPAALSLQ